MGFKCLGFSMFVVMTVSMVYLFHWYINNTVGVVRVSSPAEYTTITVTNGPFVNPEAEELRMTPPTDLMETTTEYDNEGIQHEKVQTPEDVQVTTENQTDVEEKLKEPVGINSQIVQNNTLAETNSLVKETKQNGKAKKINPKKTKTNNENLMLSQALLSEASMTAKNKTNTTDLKKTDVHDQKVTDIPTNKNSKTVDKTTTADKTVIEGNSAIPHTDNETKNCTIDWNYIQQIEDYLKKYEDIKVQLNEGVLDDSMLNILDKRDASVKKDRVSILEESHRMLDDIEKNLTALLYKDGASLGDGQGEFYPITEISLAQSVQGTPDENPSERPTISTLKNNYEKLDSLLGSKKYEDLNIGNTTNTSVSTSSTTFTDDRISESRSPIPKDQTTNTVDFRPFVKSNAALQTNNQPINQNIASIPPQHTEQDSNTPTHTQQDSNPTLVSEPVPIENITFVTPKPVESNTVPIRNLINIENGIVEIPKSADINMDSSKESIPSEKSKTSTLQSDNSVPASKSITFYDQNGNIAEVPQLVDGSTEVEETVRDEESTTSAVHDTPHVHEIDSNNSVPASKNINFFDENGKIAEVPQLFDGSTEVEETVRDEESTTSAVHDTPHVHEIDSNNSVPASKNINFFDENGKIAKVPQLFDGSTEVEGTEESTTSAVRDFNTSDAHETDLDGKLKDIVPKSLTIGAAIPIVKELITDENVTQKVIGITDPVEESLIEAGDNTTPSQSDDTSSIPIVTKVPHGNYILGEKLHPIAIEQEKESDKSKIHFENPFNDGSNRLNDKDSNRIIPDNIHTSKNVNKAAQMMFDNEPMDFEEPIEIEDAKNFVESTTVRNTRSELNRNVPQSIEEQLEEPVKDVKTEIGKDNIGNKKRETGMIDDVKVDQDGLKIFSPKISYAQHILAKNILPPLNRILGREEPSTTVTTSLPLVDQEVTVNKSNSDNNVGNVFKDSNKENENSESGSLRTDEEHLSTKASKELIDHAAHEQNPSQLHDNTDANKAHLTFNTPRVSTQNVEVPKYLDKKWDYTIFEEEPIKSELASLLEKIIFQKENRNQDEEIEMRDILDSIPENEDYTAELDDPKTSSETHSKYDEDKEYESMLKELNDVHFNNDMDYLFQTNGNKIKRENTKDVSEGNRIKTTKEESDEENEKEEKEDDSEVQEAQHRPTYSDKLKKRKTQLQSFRNKFRKEETNEEEEDARTKIVNPVFKKKTKPKSIVPSSLMKKQPAKLSKPVKPDWKSLLPKKAKPPTKIVESEEIQSEEDVNENGLPDIVYIPFKNNNDLDVKSLLLLSNALSKGGNQNYFDNAQLHGGNAYSRADTLRVGHTVGHAGRQTPQSSYQREPEYSREQYDRPDLGDRIPERSSWLRKRKVNPYEDESAPQRRRSFLNLEEPTREIANIVKSFSDLSKQFKKI